MTSQNVCYTFEAAVEMAIKMENEGFRHYLEAIRKVQNNQSREADYQPGNFFDKLHRALELYLFDDNFYNTCDSEEDQELLSFEDTMTGKFRTFDRPRRNNGSCRISKYSYLFHGRAWKMI